MKGLKIAGDHATMQDRLTAIEMSIKELKEDNEELKGDKQANQTPLLPDSSNAGDFDLPVPPRSRRGHPPANKTLSQPLVLKLSFSASH
jgi:hypothetical protein